MIKSGIYCIEVVGGNPEKIGYKYVGQAYNCKARISRHFKELRDDKHYNEKLQRYYNKYGEKALSVTVLMKCEKNELNFWEIFYIKSFDSQSHGFNLANGGKIGGGHKRECIMENIFTGEQVLSNCHVEFAKKYNLSSNSVSQVFCGRNHRVGDWFCPKNGWRPKRYEVISPEGKEFTLTQGYIVPFLKEQNIKNHSNFFALLCEMAKSYKGWRIKRIYA